MNNNKKIDTMKEFFSKGYKEIQQSMQIVEFGYGEGKGNIYESYQLYSMKVLREGNIKNSMAVLGTEISKNDVGELVIRGESKNNIFNTDKLPILLVNLMNIINPTSITVTWLDMHTEETTIQSYYMIPSPYSMGYSWWDKYSTVFNIPELDSPEGDYQAQIMLEDGNTGEILVANIDFSIKRSI